MRFGGILTDRKRLRLFDNDRVILLFRNPLYMMQNVSCSIIDKRNLYEKYESEFEEGEGEEVLDPQQIKEDLFNHRVWAPRIWRSWGFLFDCIERSNELEFPYWVEAKLWPIGLHIFDRPPESDEAAIAEEVIGTD
ncbi:hypothetical protein Golob_022107, partial [Gossypium lobatum]|nr:hypothetical protein [Gossypium lobatum]